MFMKLLVLCATVTTLVAASTIAADASRVRLTVPIQASDTASYNAGQSSQIAFSFWLQLAICPFFGCRNQLYILNFEKRIQQFRRRMARRDFC